MADNFNPVPKPGADDNPFIQDVVAEEWIQSVEGETDNVRDKEIYPLLRNWFAPCGVVIDVGSGQGLCSTKIDGYEKYIGVEPSPRLVDRARELYSRKDREFIVGDAYNLPLENETADSVFSINVWFHLGDVNKSSSELSRVLKRGGKFLIVTADNDEIDLWKSFYINPEIDEEKMVGEVKVPVVNLSRNTFYFHTNQGIVDSLAKNGLKTNTLKKLGKVDAGNLFIVIDGVKE